MLCVQVVLQGAFTHGNQSETQADVNSILIRASMIIKHWERHVENHP